MEQKVQANNGFPETVVPAQSSGSLRRSAELALELPNLFAALLVELVEQSTSFSRGNVRLLEFPLVLSSSAPLLFLQVSDSLSEIATHR